MDGPMLHKGVKSLGYVMILFLFGIISQSYNAVVILTWGPRFLHGSPVAIVVLVLFHILLVMLVWSYFRAVLTDPGAVPETWSPPDPENRSNFCDKCQRWKPPRCDHCSFCQRCVLRMDHHCIWVVNCVGARNYKFFLLFLVYAFLGALLVCVALLPGVVNRVREGNAHSWSSGSRSDVLLTFVLNSAFVASLLCFNGFHVSLVLGNATSREIIEKRREIRWKYDVGRRKNVEQVFGSKVKLWFLPLFSKGDDETVPALRGLQFPTQS